MKICFTYLYCSECYCFGLLLAIYIYIHFLPKASFGLRVLSLPACV